MTSIEQKWFDRVSAWRASGKSAPEFSAGREFRAGRLRHWALVLEQRGIESEQCVAPTRVVRLARVERLAPRSSVGALTVEVGGARLTVPAGFDETTLRATIFALCAVAAGERPWSRWVEHAGATAGATVIQAMRDEAMQSALCISTDATGVLVQPIADGKRKPCRRGHYFVQIADKDHVFFEYTAKENSAVVGEMFKGFTGYVQADAKTR